MCKKICKLCGKEVDMIGLHLSKSHNGYSKQEYYDKFIDTSDHSCPICGKKRKFININEGYRETCSIECANKMISKKVSIFRKKYYETDAGKEFIKNLSISRTGDGNPVHRQTEQSKLNTKIKLSNTMKRLIHEGLFTPCVTNSWANSRVRIKIDGYTKFYRSSWDAVVQILNPTFEYEKIRIYYINERNEEHNYITDFVDEKNKIIYEVKPDAIQLNERNILKTKYAIKWCEEHGYQYKILGNSYFKQNAKLIDYSKYDKKIYKGMKQFL